MESTKRDQDPTSTTSKVLDFTSNDTKAKALPSKIVPQEKREVTLTGGGRTRGIKRSRFAMCCSGCSSSDTDPYCSDVLTSTDKENASDPSQPLPNPKKRLKASGNGTIHHTHNPSTVLSPKSSNSRTLPHSPIRPPLGSPQKSYLSRPISPLKPASPVKAPLPVKAAVAAATAATANLASLVSDQPKATRSRAASGRKATNPTTAAKPTVTRPKRGVTKTQPAAELRSVSNGSNTSSTSTGTTVVKKGAKATPAPTKKPVGISAAGKKLAAGPKVVEGPATGRRVLRKRA